MGVGIALTGLALGAIGGGVFGDMQAQEQLRMSRAQRDLMRTQIRDNRRHAGTMNSITNARIADRRDQIQDGRASAAFGRDQHLAGVDLAREDLASQRGLARSEFGQAMDQLYEARSRARGQLRERGAQENIAGASFGSRGGSTQAVMADRLNQDTQQMEQMGEWEESGMTRRMEAAESGFRTQGQRLSLAREAGLHQYAMQTNELDRAYADTHREHRGAASALQNAEAGWDYQLGMADLGVESAQRQAAYAPWMGALQGGTAGFQLGANVYSFGAENWDW